VPGTIGDPYITKVDGSVYEFKGEAGRRYTLFERDGLSIEPRVAEIPDGSGRQYNIGVDVKIPGPSWIVCYGGKTWIHFGERRIEIEQKFCTLDAPGHFGNTTDEPHPLQGVEHMNLTSEPIPGDAEHGRGLAVDGDVRPASDYLVPE